MRTMWHASFLPTALSQSRLPPMSISLGNAHPRTQTRPHPCPFRCTHVQCQFLPFPLPFACQLSGFLSPLCSLFVFYFVFFSPIFLSYFFFFFFRLWPVQGSAACCHNFSTHCALCYSFLFFLFFSLLEMRFHPLPTILMSFALADFLH